jgi:hypothetical protein
VHGGDARSPHQRAPREHQVRRVGHAARVDAVRGEAGVPRLAGQRRVVRQQVVALHQARVGRHAISLGEQQHVARDELLDGHLLLHAAAARGDALRQHVAKRLHRALGPDHLGTGEERVQDRHGQQGPAQHGHALARLHAIGHEAEHGRHVEQEAEQVREGLHQRAQPGPARRRGERVGPEQGQPLRDLVGPEPLGPAAQDRPDLVDREVVDLPLHHSTVR